MTNIASVVLNRFAKRNSAVLGLLLLAALTANAQQATVDITASHLANSISPLRAMGAGIDRDPLNSTATIYGATDVGQMLSGGWGAISYRLNTELSVQAWHWNPTGTWSDAANQRGYFVGSAAPGSIQRSYGYNLPLRGVSSNQGSSGGYSRLDDNDTTTYWKSDPYLSSVYTGESDSLHSQWVVVDLGGKMAVNAIKLNWANPYAVSYQVQYWTGADAFNDPAHGAWVTFSTGNITNGSGGTVTLKLASSTTQAEFIRVLMSSSSGTCDTHGSADQRNCLGYAINEIYVGKFNSQNQFVDYMHHKADSTQTLTYCSSVDSWHDSTDIATDDGEQPGFDLVYPSGLTRGLPMTIPVAMLYDNPDNAAAEISYLEKQGYAIKYVELGEEPDGQFVLPEDDAALYIQWANAIHAVDPNIQLAGPVFQGVNSDIPAWPDAQGNTSWFTRFLNYLNSHGHLGDLNVMTFEHYPFNPCGIAWSNLYLEPGLVTGIMQIWRNDGLPSTVPMEITETNLAYDQSVKYMQPFAALWNADFVGTFLTAGGQAAYYYQDEPIPMYQGCGGWGTFGMFVPDNNYNVKQDAAQYFSAQMLTQQWAQPVDQTHNIYPASSNIKDSKGNVLVTVYAIQRPDGQWSVLLVNKDQNTAHNLSVTFNDQAGSGNHYFNGSVTQISFGSANYTWHPAGANGYASPDGPATTSSQGGGQNVTYTLPKSSITVLRGAIK